LDGHGVASLFANDSNFGVGKIVMSLDYGNMTKTGKAVDCWRFVGKAGLSEAEQLRGMEEGIGRLANACRPIVRV